MASTGPGTSGGEPPDEFVTDLEASAPEVAPELHVELSWGAPTDAIAYEIRYRTDGPIDATNWDTAIEVQGEPEVGTPGAAESFIAVGPQRSY